MKSKKNKKRKFKELNLNCNCNDNGSNGLPKKYEGKEYKVYLGNEEIGDPEVTE